MSKDVTVSRRQTLLTLGFGAVGVASVLNGSAAVGQVSAANLPIQKFATANPSILQRRLTDQRAVAALQLTRRLPAATPIGKMLTPSAAEGLTPGARTLTKADLSAMQLGRVSATAAKLTVKDIESVQKAFGQIGGLAASIDVSCCCCTPCCCAAAVEPVLALAA